MDLAYTPIQEALHGDARHHLGPPDPGYVAERSRLAPGDAHSLATAAPVLQRSTSAIWG